jgi:hypothetical protein
VSHPWEQLERVVTSDRERRRKDRRFILKWVAICTAWWAAVIGIIEAPAPAGTMTTLTTFSAPAGSSCVCATDQAGSICSVSVTGTTAIVRTSPPELKAKVVCYQ